MQDELARLKQFVQGEMDCADFEQMLYHDLKFQQLFSRPEIDLSALYLAGFSQPYDYLIQLDYQDAADRLNAHETVTQILKQFNQQQICADTSPYTINPTTQYQDFYQLIITSQPKYLDIHAQFFEQYIYQQTWHNLDRSIQKKHIKSKIQQLFRYQKTPPKWLRNPQWPIDGDTPLFFIGQLALENDALFHDAGYVYLFIHPVSKALRTITQFY